MSINFTNTVNAIIQKVRKMKPMKISEGKNHHTPNGHNITNALGKDSTFLSKAICF